MLLTIPTARRGPTPASTQPTHLPPTTVHTTTATALPIHTVAARWGINPGYFEYGGKRYKTNGLAPDWLIETVRPNPVAGYPLFVTGRHRDPAPGALTRIAWSVRNLDDARYDLTQAVAVAL
jgi:hypothetical protein